MEAVFVLRRVGTTIDIVEDAIVIAVADHRGAAEIVERVDAEQQHVGVVGAKLGVGLENVNERDHGPKPHAAGLVQEIEADTAVEHRPNESVGECDAAAHVGPKPGWAQQATVVAAGERRDLQAERRRDGRGARLRYHPRIRRRIAAAQAQPARR